MQQDEQAIPMNPYELQRQQMWVQQTRPGCLLPAAHQPVLALTNVPLHVLLLPHAQHRAQPGAPAGAGDPPSSGGPAEARTRQETQGTQVRLAVHMWSLTHAPSPPKHPAPPRTLLPNSPSIPLLTAHSLQTAQSILLPHARSFQTSQAS